MTELGDAGYTYTARLPRRRRGRWELSVVRTGPDGAARNLTRMTDISASDSQPGRGKRLAVAATEEWVQELRSAQERERAERARSEGIMALDAERAGRLLMPLEEYGRLFNQRRVRRSEIELSTATNWEADFRRYCVSALPQGLRVCDVTPDHVTEMIGVVIGGRRLSTDSARKGLFALNQIMRQAVAHDGLPTNPCEGIRPPRQGVPKKNPLSVRSAKKTLDQLMGLQMTPAVFGACCAILFGVAEGEICGLPLSLCDLDDTRSIYIRYAVGRNGSAFYLKEPKNRHRIRRIYLTDLMVDLFRMRGPRCAGSATWRELG